MKRRATVQHIIVQNKYRKIIYSSKSLTGKIIWILYELVLLGVLFDFLFWLTVLGYFVTKYLTQTVQVNQLPSSLPAACTNFIAFLLIFYMTACYGRYNEQHDAIMKSVGRLNDVCLFAHIFFSVSGKRKIFRHLNAAHVLSFVGLDGVYRESNFFEPINEAHKLLNKNELKQLKECSFQGSIPFQVLLSWVMETIRNEFVQARISNEEMLACLKLVLDVRGSLTRVYHFKQQPVPYSYVILVTAMVNWFLPLYAVSIGYTSAGTVSHAGFFDFFLEFLYVITYALITTGLRRLGTWFQDPLGLDTEDFDILEIVSSALDQTNKILCAPRMNLSAWEEQPALF